MYRGVVKYNNSRAQILFAESITKFRMEKLEEEYDVLWLRAPSFSMNAYLWGSIIAATKLILALGLMMRSGLYLCHHEYSLMFWGQTEASSISMILNPSDSSFMINIASILRFSVSPLVELGARCLHLIHV